MGMKHKESRELFKTAHLLLDSGVSVNNVAQTLSLSPKTIRAYRSCKTYQDYSDKNARYQKAWLARQKALKLRQSRKAVTSVQDINFELPNSDPEADIVATREEPIGQNTFDLAESVAELHIKVTKDQSVITKIRGSESHLLLAIAFLITSRDEDIKGLVDLATKLVAMSSGAVNVVRS